MKTSVLRAPGMPALVAMTTIGFSGYAALLPVAPLWAVHGGATEAGAGLVNGTLMLFTVLTQLFVPAALRRFGWAMVLCAGMVLLGLPALMHIATDALAPTLVLSAVRGLGFGILTVTGSAAVAELVEPSRRGAAIGAYGLAIAMPQFVLLPAGPWVAENLGFWVVFAVSGLPLLGLLPAIRLGRALRPAPGDRQAPTASGGATTGGERPPYLRLLRPMALLLGVTLAGGALLTFAAQMSSSAVLTTAGLLLMSAAAALTRWRVGAIADRHGAQPFVWPLVVLTAAGMAVVAWAVTDPDRTNGVAFLLGMGVVGLCYGGLQNLTLILSFNVVSRPHYGTASAVWNVGFDSGTGLGAVVVGLVAAGTSFSTALLVAAAVSLATLPLAVRRSARS